MKAKIINYFEEIRPERAFLFFGLFFGLFFVFFTPPMQVPDEWSHYVRILQIAEGDLLPEKQGNAIGANLRGDQIDFINKASLGKSGFLKTIEMSQKQGINKQKEFFKGTSTYTPVAYLPQLTGVFFAKILSSNQALIFYSARLFSLTFFLAVAYYSIKILPFGKWLFFTVAVLPMTLSLVGSNSADQMVISTSMFVIAFFLYLLYKKELKQIDIYLIFISSVLICFLKTPVVLIALIYLLLPIKFFKNLKYYIAYIASLVALISIITLVWGAVVSKYNTGEIIRTMFYSITADPKEQMSFILNNPLVYLKALIKTLWLQGNLYIYSAIGALGFQSIWFNSLIYDAYIGLLTLTIVLDDKSYKKVKKRVRLAALLIFTSMLIIIPSLLYLVYTSVGSKIIDGVQGRYFIPILFLLPTIMGGLLTTKIKKKNINYNLCILAGNFTLLSLCAYHFLNYYYAF